jgi:integrase
VAASWTIEAEGDGLALHRPRGAGHTAATVLLILAVPTPTAMAIMGWSSAAMATRYQHVLDSIRKDVAKQVGGLLWSAPEVTPGSADDEGNNDTENSGDEKLPDI